MLSGFKIEVVGALEINGPPTEEHMQKIVEIGKTLAQKIREEA
jgi:flavorubredoxin